jgi:hypothetical protein
MQVVMLLLPVVVAGWPLMASVFSSFIAGVAMLAILSMMAALTAAYTLRPEQRGDDGNAHAAIGKEMVGSCIVLLIVLGLVVALECAHTCGDPYPVWVVALAGSPSLASMGMLVFLYRDAMTAWAQG